MCGLVGIARSYLMKSDIQIFKDLLLVSGLRGIDATGAFSVYMGKTGKGSARYGMDKSAVDPLEFIRGSVNVLDELGPKVLAGHTRLASQGAKDDDDNAHPFDFPNILGMHNGSIWGQFEGRGKYGTDSEALYKLINDKGLDYALKEVERHYNCAYALVWFDKNEHTMNFIHNGKRPLYFAVNENNTALAWASEPDMLRLVLNRSDFKMKNTGNPFTYDKHTLITVPVMEEGFIEKIKTRKVEIPVYEWKGVTTPLENENNVGYRSALTENDFDSFFTEDCDRNNNYEGYFGHVKYREPPPIAKVVPIVQGKKQEIKSSLIKEDFKDQYIPVFQGLLVSPAELAQRLKKGCMFCEQIPTTGSIIRNPKLANWIGRFNYYCVECAQVPEYVEYAAYDQTLQISKVNTEITPTIH